VAHVLAEALAVSNKLSKMSSLSEKEKVETKRSAWACICR
jgi:hypothetical protein